MPEIKLLLIAGRSLKQGTGMNLGKDSPEYQQAVTALEMSSQDMQRLGVQDGDAVQLSSPYGRTGARCRKADLPEGMAFVAYGPVSSALMGTETSASGMPGSKQMEIEVGTAAEGGTHAG